MSDRAWLLMAVDADDRQFGGNDGYTDQPDVFYSWDSRVPNSHAVQARDRIVLWDKHRLLGVSVVEDIETGQAPKTVYRCKQCGRASIKRRKEKTPFFRCHNQACRAEFDDPVTEVVPVTTYRSAHAAVWVPLPGVLSGDQLRDLCVNPKSQHAIRRLDWQKFADRIESTGHGLRLALVDGRAQEGGDGHRQALTRVRIGQTSFRKSLLDRHGENCALTGPCPPEALEAGHLYRFAEVGRHHTHGGLLLRRDLHTLFDRGRLAIDPDRLVLSLDQGLLRFPMYAALHGQPIQVSVPTAQRRWIREHWTQHRQPTALNTADGKP